MKRYFLFGLIVVFVSFGVIAAARVVKPELYYSLQSLLIAFDSKGGADVQKEMKRISSIMALPALSREKKDILINHTIFLGATPNMVRLALGDPKITETSALPGQPHSDVERWVYHFADDSRPTVLQFEDHKLSSAFKVSAHKLALTGQPAAIQLLAPEK